MYILEHVHSLEPVKTSAPLPQGWLEEDIFTLISLRGSRQNRLLCLVVPIGYTGEVFKMLVWDVDAQIIRRHISVRGPDQSGMEKLYSRLAQVDESASEGAI